MVDDHKKSQHLGRWNRGGRRRGKGRGDTASANPDITDIKAQLQEPRCGTLWVNMTESECTNSGKEGFVLASGFIAGEVWSSRGSHRKQRLE